MQLIPSIILVCAIAIIPGIIAKKRGRSFWLFFFASFIITPIISALLAFLKSPERAHHDAVVKQLEGKTSIFDNMGEAEILRYRDAFLPVFRTVKEQIDEIEAFRRKALGIQDESGALPGKAAKGIQLAGKIVKNAAVSVITRTDPVYLDNDSSFMMLNDTQKMYYYKRMDIAKLAYLIASDMKAGTDELVRRLQSDNPEELKPVMKAIDWVHQLSPGINPKAKSFEALLCELLIWAFILDSEKFNRIKALSQRGHFIGQSYNWFKDLDRIFSNQGGTSEPQESPNY